jgi:hypothetical protein
MLNQIPLFEKGVNEDSLLMPKEQLLSSLMLERDNNLV